MNITNSGDFRIYCAMLLIKICPTNPFVTIITNKEERQQTFALRTSGVSNSDATNQCFRVLEVDFGSTILPHVISAGISSSMIAGTHVVLSFRGFGLCTLI